MRISDWSSDVCSSDLRIVVDGEPLPAAGASRLFRYHKPRGEITTTHDPQGRTTVFDRLPAELPRLQAVGRLDINSEGRSEEHTSELQSLMRISYAVFCLKKKRLPRSVTHISDKHT